MVWEKICVTLVFDNDFRQTLFRLHIRRIQNWCLEARDDDQVLSGELGKASMCIYLSTYVFICTHICIHIHCLSHHIVVYIKLHYLSRNQGITHMPLLRYIMYLIELSINKFPKSAGLLSNISNALNILLWIRQVNLYICWSWRQLNIPYPVLHSCDN